MIQDKLIGIQQTLKAPKDQFNTYGSYNYRSAEDILNAAKPLCAIQDCAVTLSDELVNIGTRYYIKATARLFDRESSIEVYAYAREEEVQKGMNSAQITGSASSYARKYALNGLFAIDDTKDPDATNKHEKAEPIKERKVDTISNKINTIKTIPELKAFYEKLSVEEQKEYGEKVRLRKSILEAN